MPGCDGYLPPRDGLAEGGSACPQPRLLRRVTDPEERPDVGLKETLAVVWAVLEPRDRRDPQGREFGTAHSSARTHRRSRSRGTAARLFSAEAVRAPPSSPKRGESATDRTQPHRHELRVHWPCRQQRAEVNASQRQFAAFNVLFRSTQQSPTAWAARKTPRRQPAKPRPGQRKNGVGAHLLDTGRDVDVEDAVVARVHVREGAAGVARREHQEDAGPQGDVEDRNVVLCAGPRERG